MSMMFSKNKQYWPSLVPIRDKFLLLPWIAVNPPQIPPCNYDPPLCKCFENSSFFFISLCNWVQEANSNSLNSYWYQMLQEENYNRVWTAVDFLLAFSLSPVVASSNCVSLGSSCVLPVPKLRKKNCLFQSLQSGES